MRLYHRISEADWYYCLKLGYLSKFYTGRNKDIGIHWGSWLKELKIKDKGLIHFQPKVPCRPGHSISTQGKPSTIIYCSLEDILKITHVYGWKTREYKRISSKKYYLSDFRYKAEKIKTIKQFNNWYQKKRKLEKARLDDCEAYEIIVPQETLPIELFKEKKRKTNS